MLVCPRSTHAQDSFSDDLCGCGLGPGTVITSFTTGIPGVTIIGPGTEIYILGTFVLHSAGRDYTVTVGGQTGGINVADGTDFISATIPATTPAGATTFVVTYQGQASNAIPITIGVPQPQLYGVGVLISSSTAPPDFNPYYPIQHNQTQKSVTPTSPAALGEVLQVNLTGLGPDVLPSATPTVTVGGQAEQVLHIDVNSGSGQEEVYFALWQNTPVGIEPVIVTVAGVASNTVNIPVGSGPLVGFVLNGASFASQNVIAPGSIVSVFGAGFGTQDNLSAFPSTNVNGLGVMFGSTAAPIFALAATSGQINVLVPTELPTTGTVDLTVQTSGGTSPAQTMTLAPAAPGMFYYTDPLIPSAGMRLQSPPTPPGSLCPLRWRTTWVCRLIAPTPPAYAASLPSAAVTCRSTPLDWA